MRPGSKDTLTALALVAEIGDFTRFRTAEEFIAFVGLVPSERSSGEQRRRGSITKVGNAHVHRLLVESAWHARRRPTVGYEGWSALESSQQVLANSC